jgi:hypothetical protein
MPSQEYNRFFIIIEKDTFPLISESVSKTATKEEKVFNMEYVTELKFESKKFKNVSIEKNILSNKIIDSDGKVIEKDSFYYFNSSMTLNKPKEIRYGM